MDTKPKILIVAADPRLVPEVQAAFATLPEVRPAITHAVDHRLGIEAVRSRRPTVVLLEIDHAEVTGALRRLRAFVDEVRRASPDTAVVAVFHPGVFDGADQAEGAVLIDAIRAGIGDFLRRPVSTADLSQLLERIDRHPVANATHAAAAGRVVSFVANKGGVGKSTLSTNVAVALGMRHPGRVLLVDLSIQMGVCGPMLDLEPATTVTDAARQRDRLDEQLLRQLAVPHKSGVHLLACPTDALEAAEVDEDVITRVLTLARRTYDFVVVDTFPMVDAVMMAVIDLSESVYVVAESTVPVLRGAVKMMELLDHLSVPRERRRLVLNRYSNFAGNLRPADVGNRFGQPVNHVVPYEKKLLISANLGVPFMTTAGRFSGFAKAIRQLMAEVEAGPAAATSKAEVAQ